MERLIVAVLAGGEGRRMGGVKALRPFRGTTLLGHAVRLARRWSDEVVVVVRDPAQAAGTDVPLLRDRAGVEGPLAGLAAALEQAAAQGADLLMTLPCDMPALPEELLPRLVAGIRQAKAAMAEADGALEPACGLWRTAAAEALPPYLETGGRSLQGFARAAGLAVVAFGGHEAAGFVNVNTPEALAALEPRR
jgi:molybdopterin-guanine dinucleotide biosynthesis protein A